MSSPTYRPSRFIEGEPLTHAPSVTTQPLFNSIMTEQDEHDQRRRNSDPSTSPSTTNTTDPQDAQLHAPTASPRRSIDDETSAATNSRRESTSEKIKGRLRALSALTGAGVGASLKLDDKRSRVKV